MIISKISKGAFLKVLKTLNLKQLVLLLLKRIPRTEACRSPLRSLQAHDAALLPKVLPSRRAAGDALGALHPWEQRRPRRTRRLSCEVPWATPLRRKRRSEGERREAKTFCGRRCAGFAASDGVVSEGFLGFPVAAADGPGQRWSFCRSRRLRSRFREDGQWKEDAGS